MSEILKRILNNRLNKNVLKFLKVDLRGDQVQCKTWEDAWSPFDEGGRALFDNFGVNIPAKCKYSIGIHNVMVIPETGEIFAFHTGRYSMFFKCDFAYFGLENTDSYRKGNTFDCITDITELGNEWAYLDSVYDEEIEHLDRAYIVRK